MGNIIAASAEEAFRNVPPEVNVSILGLLVLSQRWRNHDARLVIGPGEFEEPSNTCVAPEDDAERWDGLS